MVTFVIYLFLDLLVTAIYLYGISHQKKTFPKGNIYILPLIAAGVQAGVGVLQGVVGAIQKAKAAKMARANIRPILQDDPEIDKMYNLTGSMASQGLSDDSMNAYRTNNDRNTSAGIDAILMGGGSMNNIGELIDSNQQGLRQLTLANEEQRNRNIQNFIQNGLEKKADENRDEFFLNQYVPFKDNAELAAKLSEQGMSNLNKGVNAVGGAALNFLGSKMYGADAGGSSSVADGPTPPPSGFSMNPSSFMAPSVADSLAPTSMTGRSLVDNATADPNALTLDNILNRHFNRLKF